MRHWPLREQADYLNQMLRGHYAYYGIAGNLRSLRRVHRAVECYWRKMLSSRSWKGEVWWTKFQQIKERFPLLRPKLHSKRGPPHLLNLLTTARRDPPSVNRSD
jgi:hypothetical protein